jgi:hypothetical protein
LWYAKRDGARDSFLLPQCLHAGFVFVLIDFTKMLLSRPHSLHVYS